MTIIQMRYFMEVCRYGTLSRAATELHVSQPALSAAIKDLETQLRLNIFQRSGRKLMLTKDGEFLLARVASVLRNVDNLLTDIEDRTQNKNHIRLALPLLTGSRLMPIIWGEFHALYPNIGLELEEVGGIKALEMLENEEIELAVANYEKASIASLNYTRLFDSHICLCVHKDNPIATATSLNLAEIVTQPLVMLRGGYLVTHLAEDRFKKFNLKPNIMLRTSQLNTVKTLLDHNLATALLTPATVAYNPNLIPIPLDDPIAFTSGIVTKKSKPIYADTKALISFLIKKFKK